MGVTQQHLHYQRLDALALITANLPPDLHLTLYDESLIAEVMGRFGMLREEATKDLILNGGI
jgi:hypothetical protein